MSPGVATPCPAAPPIPIAKVCFIAPSLTECRPFHCSPALGRAQFKVRFPVSETPPVKNQLVFRVAGVYTQFFRIFSPARDLDSNAQAGLAGSVQGQRSNRTELRSRQIVRASAKLEAVFVGLQGAHSPP